MLGLIPRSVTPYSVDGLCMHDPGVVNRAGFLAAGMAPAASSCQLK